MTQGDGFDRVHGTGPQQQAPLGPPIRREADDDEQWVQVEGAPRGVERNVRTGKMRNDAPHPGWPFPAP